MTSTSAAATPQNGAPLEASKKRRTGKPAQGKGPKGPSRNPWPLDTKRQAVDAFERGEAATSIANRLGMHASLIYMWVRNKRTTGDVEVKRGNLVHRTPQKVGRPVGSTNATHRAAVIANAAYSVTCYRGGNLQLAGYSSQQDALDAYVEMSRQAGVERLAMWRALHVSVTVKAEVKE